MNDVQKWRDATASIKVDGYGALAKLTDLADRLANLDTVARRRFLAHLHASGVHEDDWRALLAMHPSMANESRVGAYEVAKAEEASGRAFTDLGLAERVIDYRGPDLLHCTVLGGWVGWDGRRWKTGDGDRMIQAAVVSTVRTLSGESYADEKKEEAARKFQKAAQSAGKIAAAATLARTEHGTAVDADIFDARPELLAVGNGVIELGATATFREHRRGDRLTRMTTVDYKPGATSQRWNDFLAHALPDPAVRTYVQKLAGYSLRGANDRRLLIIALGESSTGKSTLVETIGAVLGEHAADFKLSLFAGKQEDAPRPDLIDALPKRFLHASETSSRWKLHADEVKTLTGHDTQRARGMRSDAFFARKPAFTPWIATNAAPTIKGADQALWRRLVVIPFNNVVAQADERAGLADEMACDDGEAILAWIAEGWNLLQTEGLDMPDAVVKASLALRDSLSVLDAWLAEETEKDAAYTTSTDDLWTAFRTWCDDSAVSATDMGTKQGFGMRLSARGYPSIDGGGEHKRHKVRPGLRLQARSGADL